jgi:hypothetical protein
MCHFFYCTIGSFFWALLSSCEGRGRDVGPTPTHQAVGALAPQPAIPDAASIKSEPLSVLAPTTDAGQNTTDAASDPGSLPASASSVVPQSLSLQGANPLSGLLGGGGGLSSLTSLLGGLGGGGGAGGIASILQGLGGGAGGSLGGLTSLIGGAGGGGGLGSITGLLGGGGVLGGFLGR